jgi:hypothetical protein
MSKTNYLQTFISDLQRTAGPYRCAINGPAGHPCSCMGIERPTASRTRSTAHGRCGQTFFTGGIVRVPSMIEGSVLGRPVHPQHEDELAGGSGQHSRSSVSTPVGYNYIAYWDGLYRRAT